MILLRRLLLISFHDTELGLILGILHDVPVNRLQQQESIIYPSAHQRGEEKAYLLVLPVDLGGLLQLGLNFLDVLL